MPEGLGFHVAFRPGEVWLPESGADKLVVIRAQKNE